MTRTDDYPEWYLDEAVMWAFIRQGGTLPEYQTKKQRSLEECLVLCPLQKGEEIGYIDVEAPLGAERMRWMFRTPELRYLPIMLPERGSVQLVDDASRHKKIKRLEDLSSKEFLDSALHCVFVVNI